MVAASRSAAEHLDDAADDISVTAGWSPGRHPATQRSVPSASMLDEELLAILRRCMLFERMDDAPLRALLPSFRRRQFRRGEVVFHEGDPGASLHVLTIGEAKVSLTSAQGEEVIVRTLIPGDPFGEIALLDQAQRSATVTALQRSESLELQRPAFLALLDDPAFRSALLASVAGELRRLTRLVEELRFLDVAGRVEAIILRGAEGRAATPEGEVSVPWHHTQADLAAMAGTTRQSVNRVLADLADRGVIRMEPDVLVVRDVARLARDARLASL